MRLHNLIEICKEEETNGILLNIDFEKAFNSIEWDHIYRALKVLQQNVCSLDAPPRYYQPSMGNEMLHNCEF